MPIVLKSALIKKPGIKLTVIIESVALAFILLLYITLAGIDIGLPGIDQDGAHFAELTYDMASGKQINLMQVGREGLLDTYIVMPFFWIFKDPVSAVRYGCIFIGGAGLFLFYIFCKNYLNSQLWALIATIMLGTHHSFIESTRSASWCNFNIFLPLILALVMFQYWYNSNKLSAFYAGMFFLGASIGTRIHAIWIINSLIICFIFLKIYQKITPKSAVAKIFIISLASFIIGAWNLVIYNITGNLTIPLSMLEIKKCIFLNRDYFGTFRNIIGDLLNNPVRTHTFVDLLKGTYHNLQSVMNGQLLMAWTGGLSYLQNDKYLIYPLYAILSQVCLFFIFVPYFFKKNIVKLPINRILFIAIICISGVLQSLITPQDYASYHLYIFIPFFTLLIVTTLMLFHTIFLKSRFVNIVIGIIISLVIGQQLLFGYTAKMFYRISGGFGTHSDAVYRLTDWIKENKNFKYVAVNWGYNSQVYLLTGGKTVPLDFQKYFDAFHIRKLKDNLDIIRKEWQPVFLDKQALYILASYRHNDIETFTFSKLVGELGLKQKLIKSFYTRDNLLAYEIYSLYN